MNYKRASEWILAEEQFDPKLLGKTESIMCQGNGYMGVRAAAEEQYRDETRNCFVAGTFNKADETEVTELPNVADVINLELALDGEYFYLTEGKIRQYEKYINLKNGELVRSIGWESPRGRQYHLRFRRFVSLDHRHLIGQKITVQPLDGRTNIKIRTGIDATVSNSGAGHFQETQKRFYDNRYMQYLQATTDSKILFNINSVVSLKNKAGSCNQQAEIGMSRRRVFGDYEIEIAEGETLTIEKISTIYSTRDNDYRQVPREVFQQDTLAEIKRLEEHGYDRLFAGSAVCWDQYWERAGVEIACEDEMDQLAIRFSQYHLRVMTPFHDSRMNIGAKGLSGESYKGHTFWDTEVFMLPYFIFQFPEVAENLIKYRYNGMSGARVKAKAGGYDGAQYPWEAAWIEDGEVTPEYGDVDIVTGMPQKIWTGQIEQHITADVIYGLWQYYQMTGDKIFMEKYGFEMIFETASFWCSRFEEGNDGFLHINDVIGPDEYKEHVDDNAFTNYMAYWNVNKAIEVYEELEQSNAELWAELRAKLNLDAYYCRWKQDINRLYLPLPREDSVIAQDASYLTLQEIDLSKYKAQDFVLGIYRDYNAEQLNGIQVSKQADILILFFLLENYFIQEVKVANWNYYEPKTLHDSSLSLSTHCILANDIGKRRIAYELYQKLYHTDMGPYMNSSDSGIHAAAMGGIWEAVVLGFGGLRLLEDELRIRPALPDSWDRMVFSIIWRGTRLRIELTKGQVEIEIIGEQQSFEMIEICGTKYELKQYLVVKY